MGWVLGLLVNKTRAYGTHYGGRGDNNQSIIYSVISAWVAQVAVRLGRDQRWRSRWEVAALHLSCTLCQEFELHLFARIFLSSIHHFLLQQTIEPLIVCPVLELCSKG